MSPSRLPHVRLVCATGPLASIACTLVCVIACLCRRCNCAPAPSALIQGQARLACTCIAHANLFLLPRGLSPCKVTRVSAARLLLCCCGHHCCPGSCSRSPAAGLGGLRRLSRQRICWPGRCNLGPVRKRRQGQLSVRHLQAGQARGICRRCCRCCGCCCRWLAAGCVPRR